MCRMNVLMPPQRRVLVPLAVALALVAAAVSLWITAPGAGTRSLGAGNTDAAPPAGGIGKRTEQATWTVKAVPAKVDQAITEAQRKAVSAQKQPVTSTVKAVVDASLLDAVALKSLGGKELTEGVANALAHERLGAPQGAKDILITRRAAYVGIDPISSRRAAADVTVGFKATIDGRVKRFSQVYTLWLTQSDGRWQVSAFTGDRYMVKPKPDEKNKNGPGKDGPGDGSGKASRTKGDKGDGGKRGGGG